MRVFAAGRQRRIARCLLGSRQLGFQGSDPSILLGDTNQQRPDNSLGLWWLPSEHIFRDERCLGHATYVADFVFGAKANLMPQLHRRVNGYRTLSCWSSMKRKSRTGSKSRVNRLL